MHGDRSIRERRLVPTGAEMVTDGCSGNGRTVPHFHELLCVYHILERSDAEIGLHCTGDRSLWERRWIHQG